MKKLLVIILFLGLLLSFGSVWAQSEPVQNTSSSGVEINFFYSKTCPHCAAEGKFLDKIEEEYPEVKINRYVYSENVDRVKSFFEKYNVSEEKLGIVPATFVNDQFILGYNSEGTTGAKIENAIKEELGSNSSGTSSQATPSKVDLPLIGELNTSNYSLPVLTVIMGTMDGFNVCSLGALILILSLVLSLRSRTKIILYGGTYLLVAAIVYGVLIVLWYNLFQALNQYLGAMKALIGILGIGGGAYFLKEFIRFKKEGAPTCDTAEGVTSTFSEKVGSVLKDDTVTVLGTVGTILTFTAVLTVVEFPCSAAVPLVYAGILSGANLPGAAYLFYIALFVLFYLLDEIIVFAIAVWKMTVWMESPKFVTWVTLAESLMLFGLGLYYLLSLAGF
ncbi:MAG: thioredoxin family protein [Candidatus Paceibacterota bacterium]